MSAEYDACAAAKRIAVDTQNQPYPWFDCVKFAIVLLNCWMTINPDLYEADEVGVLLEKLGLLHPCTWSPTPHALDVIKRFKTRVLATFVS